MHVIGTAGHVDHGKTLLIEALTGINPDRLPEERERGMTIDLGFAWFAGPDGRPIGVIDVPGHERFIRNMVAGAWSLSCALLVVAADDGWMQQTTDHIEVLSFMRVRRLILVISKSDLAGPERCEQVRREAAERCRRWGYPDPPAAVVSAKTGAGIDRLKEIIAERLPDGRPGPGCAEAGRAGPPAGDGPSGFPYLYVDRVFSLKGSGAIVTGSLRGAPLERSGELLLLPRGGSLRIRNLQTYHADTERALPVSRVAINLAGARKEELRRGDCLTVRGAPILPVRELIAGVRPPVHSLPPGPSPGEERRWLRNDSELEIALGTGHWIGRVFRLAGSPPAAHSGGTPASSPGRTPLGEARPSEAQLGVALPSAAGETHLGVALVRIVLAEPAPVYWNQPFLLIQHGGSGLLGGGRALWLGPTTRAERGRLTALLPGLPPEPGAEDLFRLKLRLNGLARREDEPWEGGRAPGSRPAGRPPEGPALTSAAPNPGPVPAEGAIALGPWVFLPEKWAALEEAIVRRAAAPGGAAVSELTGQLQVDGDAMERVCGELRRRGRLAVRQGRLFRPDLAPEQNLTPQGRELAARLRAAGKSGLELKALTVPGAQKELRDLARAGLAVSLDGNLFLSPPIYRRLAAEVIGGQPPGDRFSVPQAKERTGLTRKYMLPLLNKMESEGLVRRVGDVRVILRVDPLLADPLQADAPREDTPRPPGGPPAPTGAG